MCRNRRFLEGVGHFERKFQTEVSVDRQPLSVSKKQSDCPFAWCQNIRNALFDFVTKHACDGQTDRITTAVAQLLGRIK